MEILNYSKVFPSRLKTLEDKKYVSGHKWSTTHRLLKSHRSKMSVIYMLSWKQYALPVITTSCAQVHELPQSHCGDFILPRLNLFDLRVDKEDGGMSTLIHSCGFACQERVLKTVPGPGHLCSEDGVVYVIHW